MCCIVSSFSIAGGYVCCRSTINFENSFYLYILRSFSGEDPVPVHDRETRNEKRLQRSVRHERKLPDLRDKLKRRGLLRRNRSEEKEKKESASGLKESENGAYNVSHKIYVKPSVVFDESSLKKAKEELPRTLTDRLVTR